MSSSADWPASEKGAFSAVTDRRLPTELLVAGGCIALSLFLDVWLALTLNIWKDEAFTLVSTSRTITYAFHRAIAYEQNAPLYFVLLTPLRLISDSVFFARAFSTLCIAGTLLLSIPLVRRYVPSISPAWYVAMLAFNPFMTWAATEIRVYAFVIFLSCGLLIAFHDAFVSDKTTLSARLLFAALACVALYTEYFFAFLFFGMGLSLLATRRWKEALYFVLYAGVAMLAFVPLLAAVPSQLKSYRVAYAGYASIVESTRTVGMLATQNAVATEWLSRAAKVPYMVLCATMLTAAGFLAKRHPSQALRLWAISLGTLAALSVATYATRVPLLNRHLAFAFIPVSLAIYATFADLSPRLRGYTIAAVVFLVAVTSLASLAAIYRPMAKEGDSERVAAYIEARERPGEPVFVFLADDALPLQHYYNGLNRIVPVTGPLSDETYDMRDFVLTNPEQMERVVNKTPKSNRTIWLVETTDACTHFNGLTFGCDVLDRYVSTHAKIAEQHTFYRVLVRRLSLKARQARQAPPR